MKSCISCGADMPDESPFCHRCGQQQPQTGMVASSTPAEAAPQLQGVPVPPAPGSPSNTGYGASPVYEGQASQGQPQQLPQSPPNNGQGWQAPSGEYQGYPPATPYPPQGQPAWGSPATAPPQKKGGKKLGIIIGCVALAVVIAVGGIVFLPGLLGGGGASGEYATLANTNGLIYQLGNTDADACVLLNDGTVVEFKENVDSYSFNYNQSILYSMTFSGEYSEEGFRLLELAIFDGKGTELHSVPDAFNVISNRVTGDIYYCKEERKSSGLYRYSGGKEELLMEDVLDYVVAPNDKYLLIISDDTLYRMPMGKEAEKIVSLEEDTRPLAISNSGKLMFYVEPDGGSGNSGHVVCRSADGTENTVKIKDIDGFSVYLNRDASEMIVESDKGLWLNQTGSFVKIFSGGSLVSGQTLGYGFIRNTEATFLPTANFDSFVCIEYGKDDEQSLRYYNKGDIIEISDKIDQVICSDDGKTIVYSKAGNLRRATVSGSELVNDSRVSTHVRFFDLSADGRHLYYVDTEDEYGMVGNLYHKELDNDPTLLGKEAYAFSFHVSMDGSQCAFLDKYDDDEDDGTIMLYTVGSDPVKIDNGTRVISVNNEGTVVWQGEGSVNDDGDDIYKLCRTSGDETVVIEKKAYFWW